MKEERHPEYEEARKMPEMIKDMQENVNILLNRRELEFIYLHPGKPTPTRQEIKQKIAAQYASPPETVIIYKLRPEFGRGSTKCTVYIYNSMEMVQKLVPKHILKRNEVKE